MRLTSSRPSHATEAAQTSVALPCAARTPHRLRVRLEDARLTLAFLPLVIRVRWQLWRAPFPQLKAAWMESIESQLSQAPPRAPEPSDGNGDGEEARQVWQLAHAVGRAARFVPRASCLTQALALQHVLARRGFVGVLHLGVDRGETSSGSGRTGAGAFEAHAWIEWRGRVVIGGNIARWTPLWSLTPELRENEQGSAGEEEL